MKGLGHQNPADQQEAQRLAELPLLVDKIAAERLAFKKPHAPISAAADELQLPRAEITPVDRHNTEYYNACYGTSINPGAGLCASPVIFVGPRTFM